MSKLFELCLFRILDEDLCTSENQFGLKRKHATYLCMYTVKSVIKYYNYFSSPVFTCFLDASKVLVPTVLVRIFFGIVHNNCVNNGVELNHYSSQ